MVSVRKAEVGDLNTIVKLLKQKAAFDRVPEALKATPQLLQETIFGESPRAHVLLAESDDRAVGFASYHEHYSTFLGRVGLWLDDLFIEECSRDQGMGKAIFHTLCRIAVEQGAARIEWCVASDNDRGISFYEGIGASVNRNQYPVRLDEERLIQMAKNPGQGSAP